MPVEPILPVRRENSERRGATSPYSEPSVSDDSTASTFWLARRALHALLCIVIPFAFLALVIRWSTENVNEKINQQIPQHDMQMEVKKFEIKEFDMEGFRKSMGLTAE
jgi:hypothetical protein